ncbi:DNA excision repair protein ERCC-6-like [Bombina bombina]|uniref:DNA excision repair protein ERCC-6-like n=1 Tax=Bombina bombina TaxID=8345 RepID=UPI00235A6D02|nr:DNA excision repair protein ERCC-6-like [Bombina bombina]
MEQRDSGDHGDLPRTPLDPEIAEQYKRFVKQGKQEVKNENLLKSMEYFRLAYNIHPNEKLKGHIEKIGAALQELDLQGEEDDEFVEVLDSGLLLYKELYNKLFDHQKEGVAFLYRLYRDGRKGGILADDMGLGKTIQIITFLSGMFDSELIKYVLLIMPTTLISNWMKEFAKWTPGMRVREFHGTSKKERANNLEVIQRKSGILITTYQMLINNWQQLSTYNGREFIWDYIILDEAHKIKSSSTKTAKACYAVPSKNRILLTGTPIQNNLREMWALYDFACQGSLLGTSKTFKMEYENPITRAREKDATPGEKALGLKISENLMKIIQPYFLRRTKNDVQDKVSKQEIHVHSKGLTMPSLTRKNDLIIWVYLSPIQEDVYRKFLSLDHIKELLMTTRSPLAELNILKKLCDHPRLLSARACIQLGLDGDDDHYIEDLNQQYGEKDDGQNSEGVHETVMKYDHLPDEVLIEESGKLRLLIDLLHNLKDEGHRTLVFSLSRKMLDIVDRILNNQGFTVMRIDGTVPLPEREKRINQFQRNTACSVLLLTTQVGGVGLTLTSADRVVIFDPSWNPATDAQAVDRAYRIGQQENVVIYRLITCGTVEEKIYRRQIFKDSLIRQTTGDKKNPFRYFSKQELKELFTLEDTRTSSTQIQLQNMHSAQRKTDTQLDHHIAFLHTLQIFGISDHDLIYTNEACSQDDDDCEDEHEGHYIQQRVQKAHELMQMESQINRQLMEQVRNGTEGAWLRQNTFPEKSKERNLPNTKPSNPFPITVDLTEDAVGDISCQMTSMVIDDSVEVDKEFPPAPFTREKSNLQNHNTNSDSLVIEDEEQNAESRTSSSSQNIPSLSPEEKIVTKTVESSLDSSSEPINLYAKDAHVNVSASSESSLIQDHNMSLNIKHVNSFSGQLHNSVFEVSGGVKEECTEFKISMSKSHLQCDFNLVLEDSIANLSQNAILDASEQEMGSVMETSVAPEKEAILVLEDSMEEENPGLMALETSEMFEMNGNRSEAMEKSSVKPQLEDGYFETVEKFHHERQEVFGSCAENKVNGSEHRSNIHIDSEEEADEVFFTGRKKTVRRICSDSESDNSVCNVEDNSFVFSPFNSPSIKGISASTPKLEKATAKIWDVSSGPRRRSIASRRSIVHVAVEETDDVLESLDDSSSSDSGEEEDELVAPEAKEAEEQVSELLEEPAGETLPQDESLSNGADEYDSDSFVVKSSSDQEEDSNTDETASNVELGSGEQMDCLAPETENFQGIALNEDRYSTLVKHGKKLKEQGNVKEALDCFLNALDIKSGDPEVMLLTLNLYRQMS